MTRGLRRLVGLVGLVGLVRLVRQVRQVRLVRLGETLPLLQVGVLVIVFVVAAVTISGFLDHSSLFSVLVLASFLGIAAAGQTLVILIGGLDLSVASVISAANLVAPVLMARGWSAGAAIAVVAAMGAAVGAVNGFVVHRFAVNSLIVTLATGGIVYGIALAATQNGQATGSIPPWLSRFASPIGRTLGVGIPPVVVTWAVIAVVLGVLLARSAPGRRLYATGANQRAADLAGISTRRVWLGAFATSGAAAALTGVLLAGFVSSSSVGVGSPYLFTSLAAVVVGGTSLIGARGDYWRTVLGALILTLIATVLVGHGASQAVEEAVYGFLILVFVGVYGRERRVRDQV
jgi:ribose transport system permease protein